MNAMEDLTVTTDGSASLNRSYDTARTDRRTRSAADRSSAKRSRIRAAGSTSSMPAATTEAADDRDQRMATEDGRDQANEAGDTSGLLGRRRRRHRRTENETEKETAMAASEPLQLTLDEDVQPANGSFAIPTDSNLLDIGSPRNTETVKTKKKMRKKPRGSSEALSGNPTEESTVDQEFEPDLIISKDFSQSYEMRTSSPVEKFSFEPQPDSGTTEMKEVSQTESDTNLWMAFDTRLNDLCKRLLADQSFDKLYVDDSSYRQEMGTELDSLKHLPTAENLREKVDEEVGIKYDVHPVATISQPETTAALPLKVRSQENQVYTTELPTSIERPVRRKPVNSKNQVEDVPAEQPAETRENVSRPVEDSLEFSAEPDTTGNRNVPNILPVREAEAHNSKLVKRKKQIDDVPPEQPAKTYENDSKVGEDLRSTENSLSEFLMETDMAENRNVPNIKSLRDSKPGFRLSSPGSFEPASRETSELGKVEVGEIPGIVLSPPTPKPVIQVPDEIQAPMDDYDDVVTAEEQERLESEQRQLIEEEELRLEQEQKERLEKEEQALREKEIQEQLEREREKAERRERKRQEKEEKERLRRERKERKELEKRQREMSANEQPTEQSSEAQQALIENNTGEEADIPAVSTQDSGLAKEIAEVKIEKPGNIPQLPEKSQEVPSRTVTNVNDEVQVKTAAYDPYADIPMVDDIVGEQSTPPVDYSHKELTPAVEKSAKKKPPSGRKMPPHSPLFPAPVPAKPEDGSTAGQKDTLTYFRVTPPRTTLKETKARDRESSARQRSRSADRSLPHTRGQSHRTGSYITLVDIDIESPPADSVPASLSASFEGGQPFSASSPLPPDFVTRRNLRPARSEEMLFVKKLSSRSPTPSYGSNDSSVGSGDGGQWLRAAKSIDVLNRSTASSEFGGGLGRRSVSREWQVVTTTTKEEIVFVKRPDEDTEERKRIKSEYEKNKQVREINEQRLTKEREKIERERLERLLAELRRRRQKERQQLLEKKLAEKKAKEENDRFIRQAVEEQRQKRLEEDRARREEEQKKRDELNEKWRKEKEQREKEKQERIELERRENLETERQFRLQMEAKERQEQEEQTRRKKELEEKREKEKKERQEREQKEKLEQERKRKEKLAHEEKLRLERMEREAQLLREKMEKESLGKEARRHEEEKNRSEKEREMMEKLAEEHRLKLEKLEEETKLQQEQLEKERLEKETEIMEKLAQEHSCKLEKLEEEARLQQEQLERERLEKEETKQCLPEKLEKSEEEFSPELEKLEEERKLQQEQLERERLEKEETKQYLPEKLEKSEEEFSPENEQLGREQLEAGETEKRATEEKRKLELERLEKEALERIIHEQKLRLEKLEREEKLRAEQQEKERIEKEEKRRLKRTGEECEENSCPMTESVGISSTEQETDSVFVDQLPKKLLSPSSPPRPRHTSQDMATQTDDRCATPTVVGEVRDYPAAVVTERLVSDSESPVSSPVPNTDDPMASPTPRSVDSPVRRRPKSTGLADYAEDTDDNSVVVHEYGELLSFWRDDPTNGQLTRARANSRRANDADGQEPATVHDYDLPPEQWTSKRLSSVVEQPNDANQSKSETRQNDDRDESARRDDVRSASATDDRDVSEKPVVDSTLGWIGQYLSLIRHLISLFINFIV